jgi:hypothetical protein
MHATIDRLSYQERTMFLGHAYNAPGSNHT